MFLWRCSHNAIAVLYNMNRKGINISPYCPRCKTSDETLEHLLFQCKFSRAAWLGSPFSSGVSPSWNSSQLMDWWHSFPHNAQDSGAVVDMGVLFASVCWFIWKARNQVHFDGQSWDCYMILEKASALCSEFRAATPHLQCCAIPGLIPMWCPPPDDMVKINVDGAIHRQNGSVGVGIIARDCLGQVLGMAAIPFTGLFSPRLD